MRDEVTVVATTQGGSQSSQVVAESPALLGFESQQSRPPADLAVEFVDFPFTDESATFEDHLAVVEREQPRIAVAPDVEAGRDPETVYQQADRLREYADVVIVVPKDVHPTDVPDRFRVGVPLADFGSDAPHAWPEYQDAGDLHLLGGSPTLQLEAGKYLPDVASVDGAAIFRGAEMGNVWAPDTGRPRNWHPTGPHQYDYYERIAASLRNITRAWADQRGYQAPVDGGMELPPEPDRLDEAADRAARDVEARRDEQIENRGEDLDALDDAERRYREARGPPLIDEDDADLWSRSDTVPGETWEWAEEMAEAEQQALDDLQDDMDQAGLDEWASSDAGAGDVEQGGAEVAADGGSEAPTMYWVKGPQGPQRWLDGTDVLISAGRAWLNSGDGFSTDVPDADRLFIDSGGYQAAVWFQDEYPFTPRELHEWAEEIGADYVAGMDWACEDAEALACQNEGVEPEDIAPVEERLARSIRDQRRQMDDYEAGDYSFQVVPVVQGNSVDQYRWNARKLRQKDLVRPYMGIGTVCKRETADGIIEVLDAVEEEIPTAEWHLFGATKEVWKDKRFWGRFRSADTHAWAMKTPDGEWTQNNQDKIEAWHHYREDIERQREKMAGQQSFGQQHTSRALASSLRAIGARECVCGTVIPAGRVEFEPGCRHCEMTKINRWTAAQAEAENLEREGVLDADRDSEQQATLGADSEGNGDTDMSDRDTYDPTAEFTDDRPEQDTLVDDDARADREPEIDQGGSDEFADDRTTREEDLEEPDAGSQASLVEEAVDDDGGQLDLTGDTATTGAEWDDGDVYDPTGEAAEAEAADLAEPVEGWELDTDHPSAVVRWRQERKRMDGGDRAVIVQQHLNADEGYLVKYGALDDMWTEVVEIEPTAEAAVETAQQYVEDLDDMGHPDPATDDDGDEQDTDQDDEQAEAIERMADGEMNPYVLEKGIGLSPNVASKLADDLTHAGDLFQRKENLESLGEDLTTLPGVGEESARKIRQALPKLEAAGITANAAKVARMDDDPDPDPDPDPNEVLGGDPFDPTMLFTDDVSEQFETSVEWQDVERPENVPEDAKETEIDLAERILRAGGARTGFGHHEEIRKSMQDWAKEDHDDDPGYWKKMAFSMTPSERSRGRLEGDTEERYKKARTVIAWASDNIDSDVLREIEDEQTKQAREAWLSTAEDVDEQQAVEQFRSDPPEQVREWERAPDLEGHPDVEAAYRAVYHGDPHVIAVYQEDGEPVGAGFLLDDWQAAGGDPQEAGINHHLIGSGDGWARARRFMRGQGTSGDTLTEYDPDEGDSSAEETDADSGQSDADTSVWNPTASGYSVSGANDAEIRVENNHDPDTGRRMPGNYRVELHPPGGGDPYLVADQVLGEEGDKIANRIASNVSPATIGHGGDRLRGALAEIEGAQIIDGPTVEDHTDDRVPDDDEPVDVIEGDVIDEGEDVTEQIEENVDEMLEESDAELPVEERAGPEIEFGKRGDANEWRDENPDLLHPNDNRSYKTVQLHPDVDDDLRQQAEQDALATRDEKTKTYDQRTLSDDEREKLENRRGWTWNKNGMEAMNVKGALIAEGATEWLDHYEAGEGIDGSLANFEASKQRGGATGTARVDSERDEADVARAMQKAEGEAEKHARDACEDEIMEACEELKERYGWSDEEIERLKTAAEAVDEDPDEIYQPTVDVQDEQDADESPAFEPVDLAESVGAAFDEWADTFDVDVEEPTTEEIAPVAPTPTEQPERAEAELSGPALRALKKAWSGYKLARQEQREAVDRQEHYAEVINGIRAVNGQDPLTFEDLDGFDGGEPIPDDPSEEYPVADGGTSTLEEAAESGSLSGKVQATLGGFTSDDGMDADPYDPTGEF